jgi:hypothetical protein
LNQLLRGLSRHRDATGRIDLYPDWEVTGPISPESGAHPPSQDRPSYHPGQKSPPWPKEFYDPNLPNRPAHSFSLSPPFFEALELDELQEVESPPNPSFRRGDDLRDFKLTNPLPGDKKIISSL